MSGPKVSPEVGVGQLLIAKSESGRSQQQEEPGIGRPDSIDRSKLDPAVP